MEIRHIITSIILLLQYFLFMLFSAILFSSCADLALPFYLAVLCVTIYHHSITEATSATIMQMLSLGSATICIAPTKLHTILL